MRVAKVGYSLSEGIWLNDYYLYENIYHLHYSKCASSKCSRGHCMWGGIFHGQNNHRKYHESQGGSRCV